MAAFNGLTDKQSDTPFKFIMEALLGNTSSYGLESQKVKIHTSDIIGYVSITV